MDTTSEKQNQGKEEVSESADEDDDREEGLTIPG